jgi:hypothetical protein
MQATFKNSEFRPSNQVFSAAMISMYDEKLRRFNCFFSVQATGDSSTGPVTENRVGSLVSSELQVPGEQGYFMQVQDHPGQIPAALFLQNVLQLYQQG